MHAIPGVAAYLDLNRQALGMTFRNPQVPAGVAVDGQPDTVPGAQPTWWTLDGPQGGLGTSLTIDTDLSATQQTWYDDDTTPATAQCTGDAEAVGEAGAMFGALACTDPGMLPGTPDCIHRFRSTTATVAVHAAADGGGTVHDLTQDARVPLIVATSTFG